MINPSYDDKFDSMYAERAKQDRITKWDTDYLALARFWALRKSKDPSTKVGAVLVSADGMREYLGYNGFPRGVSDDPASYDNREHKYPRIVHAEMNCIIKAGLDAQGGTLYTWPLFTCDRCAGPVIQAGIKRLVAYIPNREREDVSKWDIAARIAMEMYEEADIPWTIYNGDELSE